MEGRVWPWKRKSSDNKQESTPVSSSLSYLASLENQDKCKNSSYVQITMDSYTHMSKMEDQVKLFESEVKDLKEKLTIAHSEIKTKECLILQHAKVAEEAVSGWEKADAETLALKRKLESVMLLKLTAEDRASRLDDALKECTRQIRIVKDESDQKLQDTILAKTTQWDKIKAELERQIDELSQGIHRAASDNSTLTRSLQERSEMVIRIKEEKNKAEAEVEKLKTNIRLADKEISSLKYDVHVASKELEIRNEEKNMSLKSAEIASKQHLEGVKKIAKLEAECLRLKGLLKKKLPGPAAMAQMKLEVESLGHETEVSSCNDHHKLEECRRENVYLTRRASEMEEEVQRLKEALAARNNELQVSRNVCAKTLGKVKILEGQLHMSPSVTSISEDGFDEEGSSSSTLKQSNRLELMDDFLEVEKLAANEPSSASKSSNSVSSSKSINKQSSEEDEEDVTTLEHLLNMLGSRIHRILESREGISTEKIVEAVRVSIQEMQMQQGSLLKKLSRHVFEVTGETLEKHVLSSSQDNGNSDSVTFLENEIKEPYDDPLGDTLAKKEEDLEHIKLEKENLALELSRCLKNLETTKAELGEKEKLISELRSKLDSSGDLQSLAETQLKCVTESYKSLELHTKDLEAKVKSLEEETKRLEIAFSTEKRDHEETLATCRDLQEQMQRKCSSSKLQHNQEKEIESATEKLAACQETIHLLSQQLQSLQPQSKHILKSQEATIVEDHILQASRSFRHTVNPTVHAIIKSSSVSSSSKEDNEKHTRGLGRFFSTKPKNNGR